MGESPKVYGTFYGLLINQNTKVVHSKFVIANMEQKIAPLKGDFKKCSRLYDIYSKIDKLIDNE